MKEGVTVRHIMKDGSVFTNHEDLAEYLANCTLPEHVENMVVDMIIAGHEKLARKMEQQSIAQQPAS